MQTKQEYEFEIQRLKTEILNHESHLWELQEKINNHNDLLKEIKRNSV
jgi:predicted  nucleic acid-binding Zn-ribbon protein